MEEVVGFDLAACCFEMLSRPARPECRPWEYMPGAPAPCCGGEAEAHGLVKCGGGLE